MLHIISYGGGVNSTAMTLLLLKQQKPIDYILFADTGEEKPETYQFVEVFDQYLKDKHSLSITIVKPMVDGKPQTLSEYCQKHVILPSFHWRFCTDKFKIRPIRSFLKLVFERSEASVASKSESFVEYIGFDTGEWERIKKSRWRDTTYVYPLIDEDIHRIDCECIIRQHGLPIPPKSSCYFCPFTKPQELAELQEKHPDLIAKMQELEEYVNNPAISTRKKPFRFFNQYTIQQWIDIGLGRLKAEKLQLWLFDARKPCACYD
ncbi:MAG: phosphoadenosine phosphosulfate reductase domain-containing protein [Planctomycetota bacterium]|jgi:hypothetical protein